MEHSLSCATNCYWPGQKKSPTFMEQEGSLPCPSEKAPNPYFEANKSSLHHSFEIHFNSTRPPQSCFPSGLYHSSFQTNIYMHDSSLACYMFRSLHPLWTHHLNDIWRGSSYNALTKYKLTTFHTKFTWYYSTRYKSISDYTDRLLWVWDIFSISSKRN
jgi:hypothetical protein